MATIAFDTLKLARRLESAGFAREQAANTAEALSDTLGEAVVTRDHLDQRLAVTEANLNQRLAVIEANTKTAIAESRSELLKWIIGLLLGQTAILAALVKLL